LAHVPAPFTVDAVRRGTQPRIEIGRLPARRINQKSCGVSPLPLLRLGGAYDRKPQPAQGRWRCVSRYRSSHGSMSPSVRQRGRFQSRHPEGGSRASLLYSSAAGVSEWARQHEGLLLGDLQGGRVIPIGDFPARRPAPTAPSPHGKVIARRRRCWAPRPPRESSLAQGSAAGAKPQWRFHE